jgi:hypothetical protein
MRNRHASSNPEHSAGTTSVGNKVNTRSPILFICVAIASSVLLSACSQRAPNSQISSNLGVTTGDKQSRNLEFERLEVQTLTDLAVPNANALVNAYNSRDLGSPGWRRVSLELVTDAQVTNTFTVVNMWRQFENEVRTLFLLEAPAGLRGTDYLLREKADSQEMQVNLFFPAGERRVLEVGPNNFDQGLLGSDFTYNDMRMLLPVKGWRYRSTGRTHLLREPAWVVDAQPLNRLNDQISSWSLVRLYLARDFQLLLGADFYGMVEGKTGKAPLSKQMRVQSFKQYNGVWTATQIVFSGPQKRFSVLHLKSVYFSISNSDPNLFSSDQLPVLADKIQGGWSPGSDK